jgi:hypothetical protein
MRKTFFFLGILLPGLYTSAQNNVSGKPHPGSQNITALISAAADKIEPRTIAWRRDFHEHPELGNHACLWA